MASWMGLQITPSLKAALGELYYKEGFDQQGWAYVSLNDINIKDNILVFNKGVHRISIKIMDKIVPEIIEVSRPVKGNLVFDYLACKVSQQKKYEGIIFANPMALCWVKIGKSTFSNEQIDALGKIRLPVAIFRIRDLLAPPATIETKLEIRSGEEWLDELDDLRDQAESDDDYF